MRIRIALTLGALVLAGGALTGGIALASDAQAPAVPVPTQVTTRPNVPTESRPPLPTDARTLGQAAQAPRTTPPSETSVFIRRINDCAHHRR